TKKSAPIRQIRPNLPTQFLYPPSYNPTKPTNNTPNPKIHLRSSTYYNTPMQTTQPKTKSIYKDYIQKLINPLQFNHKNKKKILYK
ncbi:MAG: hypothetical protein KJ592_02010, partial [Nanoarchaeota archaeon]|nr:hypothetical protein [Nanoarchaeota archaeon]